MYNIVVKKSYTLSSGPPDVSRTHLPPHKVIIILLTISHAVLYILVAFCNYQFVILNPVIFFTQPSKPPPLWQLPVCSVSILFCSLNSTYKWNHRVLVSVWLISLSLIPARFIHAVTKGKVSLFSMASWEFLKALYQGAESSSRIGQQGNCWGGHLLPWCPSRGQDLRSNK